MFKTAALINRFSPNIFGFLKRKSSFPIRSYLIPLSTQPQKRFFSTSVSSTNQQLEEQSKAQKYFMIANELSKNDNNNEALENYRKALLILQNITGYQSTTSQEFMTIAEIHLRKGSIFYTIGSLNDALRNFKKARDFFGQFPEKDVIVAECHDNIGSIYLELGDSEKALDNFQKAVAIFKKNNLEINIAEVYSEMSLAYNQLGNKDEAAKKLEESIEIRLKHGFENNEETADLYIILGETLLNNNRYDEAIKAFNQALKIKVDLFGTTHADLSVCYSYLGTSYTLLGKTKEALKVLKLNLELQKKSLGKNNIKLAENFINIADLYCKEEEFGSALENYEAALTINKKNKKISTTNSYILYKIGTIYLNLKEINSAIKSFEEGLQIKLKNLSRETGPELFEFYEMLGAAYFELKSDAIAKKYYNKALELCRERFGETSHHTLQINLAIASIDILLKNFEEAAQNYQEILKNHEKCLDKESCNLGYVYHGMGNLHLKQGQISEAIKFFKKANELLVEHLGEDNYYLVNLLGNYGAALKANGDLDEAIGILKRGMDIVISKYGIGHNDAGRISKELKVLYETKGDFEQVQKLESLRRLCALP